MSESSNASGQKGKHTEKKLCLETPGVGLGLALFGFSLTQLVLQRSGLMLESTISSKADMKLPFDQ